jgi:hypothetical protein
MDTLCGGYVDRSDTFPTFHRGYVNHTVHRYPVDLVTLKFLRQCFPRQEPGVLEIIRKLALRLAGAEILLSNPRTPSSEYHRLAFIQRVPGSEFVRKLYISHSGPLADHLPIDFEKWDLCMMRVANEITDIVRFGHMRGIERDKPVIFHLAWCNWGYYTMANAQTVDGDNLSMETIIGHINHLKSLPAYINAKRLLNEKINQWRLLLIAKRVRAQKRQKRIYVDHYVDPVAKRHVH